MFFWRPGTELELVSEGFAAEKMRENRDKRAAWASEQAPGARAADWGRLAFKVLPISRVVTWLHIVTGSRGLVTSRSGFLFLGPQPL